MSLNVCDLERCFEKFPKLAQFIAAGTISLKMSREILGIDRYLMTDIFYELVCMGAVNSYGNNCWRATPECQQYIKDRKEDSND